MLACRRGLAVAERRSASLRIQQTLLARPEFATARVVACYAAIHGEVETELIIRAALAAGKTVLLPAVAGEGLLFRRIADPAALRTGAFGIPEPAKHAAAIPAEEIDLFVIPGVAFDLEGRRIGYGKGYYDRTLHRLEGKGRMIGFCYDFQLVDEIAGEPHDVLIDLVITEKRVVSPRSVNIEKGVSQ